MEIIKESDIINMNIYDSKSGIFESSSKTQSEMQSCKLDESESRPDITLKKMGQELDEAETKCFTLKSELNYVMGVCQKVKTEMKDTLHLSSKSIQLSPRRIVDNDDANEEFESLEQQKQNGLLNVTITPRTQLDKKLPITMTMRQSETLKASGEYENSLSFPEYVREHFQSMLSVENSVEEITSKVDEENYFHVIPLNSAKKDRTAKLNLNIPETKVRRAEKSKRASRMERSESNSIYNKTSHTLSKVRKKKGRLRNSVSKSTVATKDTSLIGRKEAKKRRHKGHGIIHQLSNPPKNLKRSNDIVEIFHNITLKSSNSGISNSKHSKFDKQTKRVKRHPIQTANRKIQETPCSERVNHEYQIDNKENEQHQSLNYQCDSRVIPERVQEHDISEKHSKDFYPSAQCNNKMHQCEHNTFNKYNDPMFIPNYEMPTLASSLKRSNRSYFNRFNFRNIPFVVGTSVTPSHNLGLNIQQVLSIMKTRQPIANDITPLLIRKVSRGIKPMSILLEQMNDYSQKSALNINSHLSVFNNSKSSNIKRDKKLSVYDLRHVENSRTSNLSGSVKMIPEKDNDAAKQFNKEKIDFNDHKIKLQSPVVNKNNMSINMRSQQGIAKISSNKEINIGDYKTHTISGAHNSKEIREILINLHDQFEEMNTKYEKLQSEVEKSNDKSLGKELSVLEKELNIKEEEINAVIGLYKEVMTLKQQMKMLHEKNSLVCITTESVKGSHKNSFAILPGKSHSMNPTQIFGRRKFNNATREPPTSMQLAALLRQIQTFYKQMQLVF